MANMYVACDILGVNSTCICCACDNFMGLPYSDKFEVSVGELSIEHTTIDKREKFSPHGRGPPNKKGKPGLKSVEAVSSENDLKNMARGAPPNYRLHDGHTSKLLDLGASLMGRSFIDTDCLIDAVNKGIGVRSQIPSSLLSLYRSRALVSFILWFSLIP